VAHAPPASERPASLPHGGIAEVQVALMEVEPVPVVGFGLGIPAPVGALEVAEDDPRVFVLVTRVTSDVEVSPIGSGTGAPRAIKPPMLRRNVVDHELGDDAQPRRCASSRNRLKSRRVP